MDDAVLVSVSVLDPAVLVSVLVLDHAILVSVLVLNHAVLVSVLVLDPAVLVSVLVLEFWSRAQHCLSATSARPLRSTDRLNLFVPRVKSALIGSMPGICCDR